MVYGLVDYLSCTCNKHNQPLYQYIDVSRTQSAVKYLLHNELIYLSILPIYNKFSFLISVHFQKKKLTNRILSFASQLCSNKVELMAHNDEQTPFDNGKFGSQRLLFNNKSTASLFPLPIAKLRAD